MLDERKILPFNFLQYGGVYSGQHSGMRYKIERKGQKPDFVLTASVWMGPYASDSVAEDSITVQEFEYSEEGRLLAIEWLSKQYNERQTEWDNPPVVNEADIKLEVVSDISE